MGNIKIDDNTHDSIKLQILVRRETQKDYITRLHYEDVARCNKDTNPKK